MIDDATFLHDRQRYERIFAKGLLTVLFLVVVVRLLGFLIVFNYTVLQMDFAAFYIAGKSVSLGLSPYVNYVESDPTLWDGVAAYTHSRFLYPPLTARPFQILALMHYHVAKFLWILTNLIALAASMILAFRLARLKESTVHLMTVGIIVGLAYPTLTLFERGQVDALTLLLILGAILLMNRGTRSALVAGGLLALATLVKLNCILLLPFLLLRKRWHASLGLVAGLVLLVGISLVVDGREAVSDYAFLQMPRIAEYGEGGPVEMALPRESFGVAIAGLGAGFSRMDGRPYRRQMFRFVINASFVQTGAGVWITSTAEKIGLPSTPTRTAVFLLALFVLLILFWQRRYGALGGGDDPVGELVYWQLAMAVLLFCGPVTWAMSTVWLLPLAVVLIALAKDLRGKGEVAALLVCATGLLAAVIPDSYHNFMFSPFPRDWLNHKYIFAEVLVIVGLLWFWRQRSLRIGFAADDDPAVGRVASSGV